MTNGPTSTSSPRRVAQHVQPEVTEARLARQWSAVAARARSRRPVRAPMALALGGVAFAVAASVVWLVLRSGHAAAPPGWAEGTTVDVALGGALDLPDGTHVTLRGSTRVTLEALRTQEVHLVLKSGSLDIDVAPVAGRRFLVSTDRFDVVDVGTRFQVSVDDDGATRVRVDRGRVQVTPRHGMQGAIRVLDAGDSWSSAPSAPQPEAPSAAAPAASVAPPPDVPSAASSASARSALATLGPKELLEAAQEARLQGHPREAAVAFDALRRRFRSDPRAGLAAFELGRLRLDAFGEPGAALEAFDDAIALSPGAPFREDAEARRVDALDRMHAPAQCAAARDAYLAAHPGGVHAATVASRCGGR